MNATVTVATRRQRSARGPAETAWADWDDAGEQVAAGPPWARLAGRRAVLLDLIARSASAYVIVVDAGTIRLA